MSARKRSARRVKNSDTRGNDGNDTYTIAIIVSNFRHDIKQGAASPDSLASPTIRLFDGKMSQDAARCPPFKGVRACCYDLFSCETQQQENMIDVRLECQSDLCVSGILSLSWHPREPQAASSWDEMPSQDVLQSTSSNEPDGS